MANLNKVMLIGNLTRDPEVKYTPKGTAVAEVSLAVNRTYSTDGGEKREETTFIDVELWGRQAELAGEYLKKGRSVYFEGRLKLDTWDDKTSGQKRSKMRVVAETMQFLGGPRDSGSGGGGSGASSDSEEESRPQRSSAPAAARPAARPAPAKDPDLEADPEDDIPF